MTAAGATQQEICEATGRGRGSVQWHRRRMGLITVHYRGRRTPDLTAEQKKEVLSLLKSGMGTIRISAQVGVPQHTIRSYVREIEFKHAKGPGRRIPIPRAKLAQLKHAILNREAPALVLARQFKIPYKTTLAITKETLNCERLKPGRPRLPLDSHLPQRWPDALRIGS